MYIISYDVALKSLAMSLIFVNRVYLIEQSNLFNKLSKMTDKLSKTKLNTNKNCNICTILKSIINILDKLIFYKNNTISLILFDIVDLIPNTKIKDTDTIIRAERLKSYLHGIDSLIYKKIIKNENFINKKLKLDNTKKIVDTKVLIEYQMGPNDKSRNVCSQILYNYSHKDNYEFKSINYQTKLVNTNAKKLNNTKKLNYISHIIGPSLKNKINLDNEKNHQFFLNKYSTKYDANKKHSIHNFSLWIKSKLDNLDKLDNPNKKIYNLIKNIPKKNLDDIADSVNMTLAWLKYNKTNNI